MSITLNTLANWVYRRLNESANTDIPTLPSGTNSTPTLDAITGVVDLYNATMGELCRTCLPIPASGSLAGVTVGTATVALSSFTLATAGVSALWCVTEAQYSGTALLPVGYMNLLNWVGGTGGLYTATTGPPAYFAEPGESGPLFLYPRPSTSATLTVGGLGIPTAATSGSDSTSAFLYDDLLELVECRIASMLAKKNLDDPTLAARAGVWDAQYDARRMQLWSRIAPPLRAWRYPAPPIVQEPAQPAPD